MKKTLCSLVCLGALSLNADVLVGIDVFGTTIKEEDGVKLDDKTGIIFNAFIQDFKINDEDGITGALKLGVRGYDTNATIGNEKYKLEENNFYYDLMLGYGFNLSQDDIKHALNILIGFNHQNYENKIEVLQEWEKTTIKTNALKAGVNYYAIAQNNVFINAELFVKNYLDDKRNAFVEEGEKKDSKTKIEGDIAVGYKFNGANSGAYVGLKVGYHDDLIGKGAHYGITGGYIF